MGCFVQKMTVPFSVLLCKLKSCVTKIRLNPAKRNLFRSRSDILPGPCVVGYRPRPSCDGFESRAIGPSGGKTPPPYRGGGPEGRRGFLCTRATFPFYDPFMLSVDASGGVRVGVSPLRPFAARPPAKRDSFGIRMANRRSVTSRAELVKSSLNFDCP